jgi:hypothetical protein
MSATMSRWTHAVCDDCWKTEHPDQSPYRFTMTARFTEKCCYCGNSTDSGIYIRTPPDTVGCGGEHEEPS